MKRNEVVLEGQKYPRDGVEREIGWCMRVEAARTEPSNGQHGEEICFVLGGKALKHW